MCGLDTSIEYLKWECYLKAGAQQAGTLSLPEGSLRSFMPIRRPARSLPASQIDVNRMTRIFNIYQLLLKYI
jgi:hypothetical protein